MTAHEFLLNEWGSRRYSKDALTTIETCRLMAGYAEQQFREEEELHKVINAEQHNQLNIIDEVEEIERTIKAMRK